MNTNQIRAKGNPNYICHSSRAEESETSTLVGCLSLLEVLKFLVYAGFWRIHFLGTVSSVKVLHNKTIFSTFCLMHRPHSV